MYSQAGSKNGDMITKIFNISWILLFQPTSEDDSELDKNAMETEDLPELVVEKESASSVEVGQRVEAQLDKEWWVELRFRIELYLFGWGLRGKSPGLRKE